MNLPVFMTTADVTDDNLAILAGYVESLSMQDDNVIKMISSSQILDPQVQRILQSENVPNALDREFIQGSSVQDAAFEELDQDFSPLLFPESAVSISSVFSRIKGLFIGLRRKVRRIFCQVVKALGNAGDLDLKSIIKNVLLALIPALAVSSGLIPVALPILVSLAALLLKYGIGKVCPV